MIQIAEQKDAVSADSALGSAAICMQQHKHEDSSLRQHILLTIRIFQKYTLFIEEKIEVFSHISFTEKLGIKETLF